MKRSISVFCLLILSLACASATASAESEVEVELKPFTAQTNYISLPGYFRHEHYLQTGKWLSLDDFVLGYPDTRIMRLKSTVTIDIGNLGQMGDDEGENMSNLSLVAKSLVIFPTINKYKVMWSYSFSTGEGENTSLHNYEIVYDKSAKTLEDMHGVKTGVTDNDIFEANCKNIGILRNLCARP